MGCRAWGRAISFLFAVLVIPACHGGGTGVVVLPPALDVRIDQNKPGAGGGVMWPRVACDGATIYAVWQDFRNFGGAVWFNRSSDGGLTWLPSDVRIDRGGPLGGFADLPLIACSGANVYVVWQDQRNGLYDIYFNRSTDGGATWLPADVRMDTDAPGSGDSQYPALAADGAGVHVVWHEDVNGIRDIYYNGSTDGGATWLPTAKRLDTDPAGTGDSSNPKIACQGSNVYVTWNDFRTLKMNVRFNRSSDAGATWLASDVRLDHVAPGETAASPLIACVGAHVYVAWHDDRNGKFDVYFNRSTDSGVTWLGADVRIETDAGVNDSYLYNFIAAGTGVYAAWIDGRHAGNAIYFNGSTDSGATWLGSDVRLDTPASGASGTEPRLAVSGSNVHAVWTDYRSPTDYDVYYNRSTDGGATWQASDLRLDHGGTAYAIPAEICCSGANIVAIWRDSRDSFSTADRTAVFGASSADNGVTWTSQDARVSHTLPAGINGVSASPTVVTSGTSVYVAWIDYRLGPKTLFFNRSKDSGVTWRKSDVRLGDADAQPQYVVRMAGSGSHLFVIWDDLRNGQPDIYFNRSKDGGATWLPHDVRLDTDAPGAAYSAPVDILADGDDLIVLWVDNRTGSTHLYCNRSSDGGRTWMASDLRIDHGPLGSYTQLPRACRDGDVVGVVWGDPRNGQQDVYFNRSLDGGRTWMGSDLRLDTDTPGAALSVDPQIACSGSNFWVVWEDVRNGGQEILMNRSSDGGLTWLPSDVRIDRAATNAMDRSGPSIVKTGGTVMAVWGDSRGGGYSRIYMNRSTDDGATWLASDVKLDSNPNATKPSISPKVIGRDDTVYVVWEDCRDARGDSDTDVYCTRSLDGGVTWEATDVRLDVGDAAHKQSTQIQLTWGGVWPFAVWTDLRHGAQDIYLSALRP